MDAINYVAFYDKPFLKFERLLETYVARAARLSKFRDGNAAVAKRETLPEESASRQIVDVEPEFDWENKLLFAEHHQSHAASAFFPSPFEEAAVLTMDGVGEWATTSMALGSGNNLEMVKEIHFPHSLGLLYSAFTYYTGFRVNSGEYKVMGLAPYGQPVYRDLILENLIDLKADGTFRLNMDYFDYCTGLTMTNARFDDLFGAPPRNPESRLDQRDMDLGVNKAVTEEVVLRLVRSIVEETGIKNVALRWCSANCVANGKVLRDGAADKI